MLANNDVPSGAARIPLHVALPSDWEGWDAVPPEPEEGAASVAPPPRLKRQRSTPRRTRGALVREGSTASESDLSDSPRRARSADVLEAEEQRQSAALAAGAFAAAAADVPATNQPASPAAGPAASPFAAYAVQARACSLPMPCGPHSSYSTRVLVVSESAWQAAAQQAAAEAAATRLHGMALSSASSGSDQPAGAASRSFSLPAMQSGSRQQAYRQLQQQGLASSPVAGSSLPAYGMARTLPGPSAADSQWLAASQASLSQLAAGCSSEALPFAKAASLRSLTAADGSAALSRHAALLQQHSTSPQQAAPVHRADGLQQAAILARRQAELEGWVALRQPLAQTVQPSAASDGRFSQPPSPHAYSPTPSVAHEASRFGAVG